MIFDFCDLTDKVKNQSHFPKKRFAIFKRSLTTNILVKLNSWRGKTMEGACETCRYYENHLLLEKEQGYCRYNPPMLIRVHEYSGFDFIRTGWPEVNKEDWCGKHEKPSKEGDAEEE